MTHSRIDAEQRISSLLAFIGEDVNREGLKETPGRVIRSWETLYGGYKQDPQQVLGKQFSEFGDEYDQVIILKDIEFFSTCEHHMLPFFGTVDIGYLPDQKVVGVSKLARVVDVFSRRLQIQEKLTAQIGAAIRDALDPAGVGVLIRAQHFCITSRGVRRANARMCTSYLAGRFREAEIRQEFLSLVGIN